MKDLILRIAIGSLVSAIVSGGILYFAFDQSLRGVETAVETVSTGVAENGAWIRENRRAIDDGKSDLSNKLDLIADQISANSIRNEIVFARYDARNREIFNVVAQSMTTTVDTITILKNWEGLTEEDAVAIERMISRLEMGIEQLNIISASYPER